MGSSADNLQSRGYLSLKQLVEYLKEFHPQRAFSYPTGMKMIAKGQLRASRVGETHRIHLDEIQRFIAEGNYVPEEPKPIAEILARNIVPSLARKVSRDEPDPE